MQRGSASQGSGAGALAVRRTVAYPRSWRIAAAVLVAVSRASLPVLVVKGLLTPYPISLSAWFRMLGAFALLPAAAAWLIARACTVEVEVGEGLVLRRHGLSLEVPWAAIAQVVPWTLPLPGPGFAIRLRSGRRLRYDMEIADAADLVSAIAARVETARTALQHPSIVYARAQRGVPQRRWYHALGKFPGFALLPAAVMFNLHQHVVYGGLFGQYYRQGLQAYLKTFGIYWGLTTVYVLLYASVWRVLAEGVAWLSAWLAPARAAGVRQAVEIGCRLAYYVGVPVIILIPFLR